MDVNKENNAIEVSVDVALGAVSSSLSTAQKEVNSEKKKTLRRRTVQTSSKKVKNKRAKTIDAEVQQPRPKRSKSSQPQEKSKDIAETRTEST